MPCVSFPNTRTPSSRTCIVWSTTVTNQYCKRCSQKYVCVCAFVPFASATSHAFSLPHPLASSLPHLSRGICACACVCTLCIHSFACTLTSSSPHLLTPSPLTPTPFSLTPPHSLTRSSLPSPSHFSPTCRVPIRRRTSQRGPSQPVPISRMTCVTLLTSWSSRLEK